MQIPDMTAPRWMIAVLALSIIICAAGAWFYGKYYSDRAAVAEQHAVIVHFDYAANSLDALYEVEGKLERAVNAADVGEFDGNEIAVDLSDGSLYMYGPDAEALFAVVRPILTGATCLRNTRVTLRFGPPEDGVRERIEVLDH
jgi:hypothetical protein